MNSEPPVTFIRDPDVVAPATPITTTSPIDVNVISGTLVANVPPISTSPQPIKDGVGATLSTVQVANGATAVSSNVLLVQHIDDQGNTLREITQDSIDLNTANTALVMLDLDETGSRQVSVLQDIKANTSNFAGTAVLRSPDGNPLATLQHVNSEGKHLGVALIQDVVQSESNTTSTPLPALGTWTGVKESTLGVAGIQVMVKTDTNCIVYIDQSADGINWDIVDPYQYDARRTSLSFGVTVQAVGSYYRVRLLNRTPRAQTYLRVATALCPTVEALPRSLDEQGKLRVGVYGQHDSFGFQGEFTPMRDMKVAEPYRLVGASFAGTVDPNFWICTNAGSNSYSSIFNGVTKVYSGGANAGYGQLQSVRPARFVFAHPHMQRSLIRVDGTLAPSNVRRWGAFTTAGAVPQPVDGFYFQVNGHGTLSCNCAAGGVVGYSATSGDFNGLQSDFLMDTNVHAYEIVHLIAGAWFYIDDVLVHQFVPASAPLSNTFTLPVTVGSVNQPGVVTSGTLECWASTILRLGRDITAPISYFHPSSTTAGVNLKLGAGTLQGIVILSVAINNGVLTVYDSTTASGRILLTTGALPASTVPTALTGLNIPFFNGLTFAVTGQNMSTLLNYE